MEGKRTILIVCGYGCDLNSPLRPYLDRVIMFLKENQPLYTITCGGFTQRAKFPHLSEGGMMFKYIMENGPYLGQYFYISEGSYTTPENIKDAGSFIRNSLQRGTNETFRITIFCEATRALRVVTLAQYYLKDLVENVEGDIAVETVSWERASPMKEALSIFKDWLSIRIPLVASCIRSKRIRKAKKA
ncbi:MAG: hypothetical protein KBC81_00240 [Candidatus Pacebacteria bacterium]|nr:hypothetical protein [Candidatus Paceibacterota bacterium]